MLFVALGSCKKPLHERPTTVNETLLERNWKANLAGLKILGADPKFKKQSKVLSLQDIQLQLEGAAYESGGSIAVGVFNDVFAQAPTPNEQTITINATTYAGMITQSEVVYEAAWNSIDLSSYNSSMPSDLLDASDQYKSDVLRISNELTAAAVQDSTESGTASAIFSSRKTRLDSVLNVYTVSITNSDELSMDLKAVALQNLYANYSYLYNLTMNGDWLSANGPNRINSLWSWLKENIVKPVAKIVSVAVIVKFGVATMAALSVVIQTWDQPNRAAGAIGATLGILGVGTFLIDSVLAWISGW